MSAGVRKENEIEATKTGRGGSTQSTQSPGLQPQLCCYHSNLSSACFPPPPVIRTITPLAGRAVGSGKEIERLGIGPLGKPGKAKLSGTGPGVAEARAGELGANF